MTLEEVGRHLQPYIGVQTAGDLTSFHVGVRTVMVYAATLLIVRLGNTRFLGKATAFDVVVSIMLGSVMSRAIDGSSPFFPTLMAGAVLIGTHWLFAWIAYHTDWFGPAVKGDRILLIKDGKVQEEGMERGSITLRDLTEALRLKSRQRDPARIKRAYLERSGEISVIPYSRRTHPPRSDRPREPHRPRSRSSRNRDTPDHGQRS